MRPTPCDKCGAKAAHVVESDDVTLYACTNDECVGAAVRIARMHMAQCTVTELWQPRTD